MTAAGINSKRAFVESASSRRRSRRSLNVTAQRRILASARKYLCQHSDRPIYADEVREALKVSQASLTDAFLSRLGVTPERFLTLRRLRLVRAALRPRVAPTASVKSVAVAHGFWDLPRFYADYHGAFGEWPFETVLRGRGSWLFAREPLR